jgi:hypothetical protein
MVMLMLVLKYSWCPPACLSVWDCPFTCFSLYSKICNIQYWIIQKSLLTGKLTKSLKLNKEQLTVTMCKCHCTLLCKLWWKGLESAAWKTGQDIKWQVKWLGLSMWLLCTLRCILSIIFWYVENCDIWQTIGTRAAGYQILPYILCTSSMKWMHRVTSVSPCLWNWRTHLIRFAIGSVHVTSSNLNFVWVCLV